MMGLNVEAEKIAFVSSPLRSRSVGLGHKAFLLLCDINEYVRDIKYCTICL